MPPFHMFVSAVRGTGLWLLGVTQYGQSRFNSVWPSPKDQPLPQVQFSTLPQCFCKLADCHFVTSSAVATTAPHWIGSWTSWIPYTFTFKCVLILSSHFRLGRSSGHETHQSTPSRGELMKYRALPQEFTMARCSVGVSLWAVTPMITDVSGEMYCLSQSEAKLEKSRASITTREVLPFSSPVIPVCFLVERGLAHKIAVPQLHNRLTKFHKIWYWRNGIRGHRNLATSKFLKSVTDAQNFKVGPSLCTTGSKVVCGNRSSIKGSFFVPVGRMYNNLEPYEHFLWLPVVAITNEIGCRGRWQILKYNRNRMGWHGSV
jgi:hypothetical protein